ncbi:MAG TPA: glycosyltransferase family 4 protein [Chloroflexota bacterium]|nr:glycosyltransferase family 4 protein [Chloroflexota bacterium]
MAILLLAPFVSGAEQQTLALCRYLASRCRVTLLTNDELAHLLATDDFFRQYTAELKIQRLGPAFPPFPARSVRGAAQRLQRYPRLQLGIWRALRRLRPTLVHLILTPSFFAYAPLFHLLPFPVVLTLSGEMRYVRHFYGPAKRAAVRYAVARADALVVCSADEMANLTAVSPAATGRAVIVDNFTDVARFTPAGVKEPLVTFAARLHPEKGALLFLDAVARVRATHPHARFALMGRGELEPEVSRRLQSLQLTEVVQRGFTTDLAPCFARSSIFVSCQQYENLGSSSLLEAMACENAIVATDVGQTWRIVDDAVGYRVPPRPEAVADGISALLSDPPETARRGRAARRRVLDRYRPDVYVERLLEVYRSATARSPRRG